MNFRSNDPGAVQFGNFINYYQFNSATDRLKLLPTDVWTKSIDKRCQSDDKEQQLQPYLVLDVGCNAGDFTQLLWGFLSELIGRPVLIMGVDIDEALIVRAQQENAHVEHIRYAAVDVMKPEDFTQIEAYLQQQNRTHFDAICCFSITMWIHLNHCDVGLQHFLRTLANMAELFVVEPQPWRCYQTAERRMRKAGEKFELLPQLEWRTQVEQQIQTYLEQTLGRHKVHECCPTKWKRRICFYR